MAKQTLKSLELHCSRNYDSGCRQTLRQISDEITSNDHIYQPVKVVDQALFNRMKQDYQNYFAKLPIKGQFVLPAYTDKKTTYLFPDYFDAGVDRRTRSLYLIHEAVFSRHPKNLETLSLEKVLKFDVAILAVISSSNPVTVRALRDALTVISTSSSHYTGYLEIELIGNYLEYLADIGIAVSFDQLFSEILDNQTLGAVYADTCTRAFYDRDRERHYRSFRFTLPTLTGPIQVDPFRLSKNRQVEADFFKTFFGKTFSFKCPSSQDEIRSAGSKYTDLIVDLEFRGVQVFNKKTGKPVPGLTYYQNFGFHPIKMP